MIPFPYPGFPRGFHRLRWLGWVVLLTLIPSLGWAQVPTPDPRADLDRSGIIDWMDLIIFQYFWFLQVPTPTPTYDGPTFTPTPSPTVTPTWTETPTPSLTPTVSLNGRLFGVVTDKNTGSPVSFFSLFLDLPSGYTDQNTFTNDLGYYEFTGLPIGELATLSNNTTTSYASFQIALIISENLERDIELAPYTPTPTKTSTGTATMTPTITDTPTRTDTPTDTGTPTITPTPTITSTRTETNTGTPSSTETGTRTPTPSRTPTQKPSTSTPTPTRVVLTDTEWLGTANIDGGVSSISMYNDPEDHTLSSSQVRIVFKSTKKFVNTPTQSGTQLTFPLTNDEDSTGASLGLSGAFTDGDHLSGTLQYRGKVSEQLKNGTFTMTRQ